MDREEVIENLRRMAPWHYDIEVLPGLRTSAFNRDDYGDESLANVALIPERRLEPLLRWLYRDGLSGKSFLDVGCNAGDYCFSAKRLGADRVYGFDARERWIEQALFLKQVLDVPTEGLDFRVRRLSELSMEEKFDITIFSGILYHLPDPIRDLEKVCSITSEMILVNTAYLVDAPSNSLVAGDEGVSEIMSGVDGPAWMPGGVDVVITMLRWFGFPETRITLLDPDHYRGIGWGRLEVLGSKTAETFASFDALKAAAEG